MKISLRGREFSFMGIEIRIPCSDELTNNEKKAIDHLAISLGYKSVADLAVENGYSTAGEVAYSHSFKNPRDYFLGKGWSDRLAKFDRNKKVILTDEELNQIDPNYATNMLKIRHTK